MVKISQLFNFFTLIGFCLIALPKNLNADVKISNLDDFNFGLYSGLGRLRNDDNICINTLPSSNYQITFWGSGSSGAFEISNGIDTLNYIVHYNDRARRSGSRRVTSGIPLQQQNQADTAINCPGNLNANIQIRLRRKDLQAATPGRYIGLLTVTVVPE